MSQVKMNGDVLGIGNDIIEIERIRKAVETHGNRFLNRLFTLHEQAYCLKHKDPAARLAGRFAAKEAVAKALGTGFGKNLSWQDIEILNNQNGEPEVFFSSSIKAYFNNPQILVSISHCKSYASAVAIQIR